MHAPMAAPGASWVVAGAAGGLLWSAAAFAATPTPTLAPSVPDSFCLGDCDRNGVVRINEIITGLNVVLGDVPPTSCPAVRCEVRGVGIHCLIGAVDNAAHGCPTPRPTRTPLTVTPTPPAISPTPFCVPSPGIPSFCAAHCDPCPTIRVPGCAAIGCRDCIENPRCAPSETCVLFRAGRTTDGCCYCATPTAAIP